ncbi:MAG: hypothetical protein ACEQSR_16325 [Candidatus Methylacidiphilales bacterium]
MKKNILQLCLLGVIFLASNQTFGQANNKKDSTTTNQTSSDDDDDEEDDEEIQAVIKEKERLAKQMASDSTKKALKAAKNLRSGSSEITFGNTWALSIGAGTLGFGGTINKKITNHFSVNLGYYSGNLSQSAETKFNKDNVNITANVKVGAAVLLFDYFPSVGSSFHFTGGVAYNFNNYKIDITPKGTQSYGLMTYSPEQIGTITFDITGANFAPYLGIGFGRGIPKKRVGIGLDLGAFYYGTPKTKLSATGSFEPSNNEYNQALVQKAFDSYKFYPYITIKLNIKIAK